METTIVEYQVVSKHDRYKFADAVNELISDGWQPFGNIQVSGPVHDGDVAPLYTQAMVKYKK